MKAVSSNDESGGETAGGVPPTDSHGSGDTRALGPDTIEPPKPSKEYLEVPLIPSRPSSPGTLSNVSVEDWQANQRPKLEDFRNPSSWRAKLRAFWVKNLGIFYMIVAQFFGIAMNVTTRFLEVEGNHGKGLHPFQVLFARMSITIVLATLYMWYAKTPHFPFGAKEVRWLLVARGIGGFFGVFGMYYSLMALPISDATVITYLAPGLSCWACSILIKEPFTHIEKIGTFVSLFGVIFIARPTSILGLMSGGDVDGPETPTASNPDMAPPSNTTLPVPNAGNFDVTPDERIAAVGMALVGVMGAVAAFTTIRWIGKRAHPLISVSYFSAWCTAVSIIAMLTLPGVGFLLPADLKEWGMLIFLGTCGFIMQFLLAAALSYEKSSRVTNMTYTSMLFALASDKIFFGTSPGVSSIVGSTLILGAAIVMALQKAQPAPENKEGAGPQADEERGLMGNMDEDDREEERMPIQEVQLRTLR
ncbi:EamA-like transporter-like protein 3 [Elsinoe fawcettii]|nr:EamA-like transporter-like protein 3 [Elsinoe fawcettii]